MLEFVEIGHGVKNILNKNGHYRKLDQAVVRFGAPSCVAIHRNIRLFKNERQAHPNRVLHRLNN